MYGWLDVNLLPQYSDIFFIIFVIDDDSFEFLPLK